METVPKLYRGGLCRGGCRSSSSRVFAVLRVRDCDWCHALLIVTVSRHECYSLVVAAESQVAEGYCLVTLPPSASDHSHSLVVLLSEALPWQRACLQRHE